jgi:hypothetical protein
MKLLCSIALLCLSTTLVAQQKNIDSLKLPSTDTLTVATKQKIDSIQQEFRQQVSKLKGKYTQTLSQSDSLKKKFSSKIDSLRAQNVSTAKVESQLDSLQQRSQVLVSSLTSRVDSLKRTTAAKLDSLKLPPKVKSAVGKLSGSVQNFTLNDEIVPDLKLPNYSLPAIDGSLLNIPSVTIDTALPTKANIEIPTTIPENNLTANLPTDKIAGVKEAAKSYSQELKAVTTDGAGQAEKIPTALENKASEIGGVDNLTEQAKEATGAVGLPSEEATKEQLMKEGGKAAMNHFAGKEDVLTGAMEKMSKYKEQYSTVVSMKDALNKRPNPMKSKTFIERITHGVYFQYQRNNNYLIDINLYTGYKLTERLTSGIGWNQRIARDKENEYWNKEVSIYGPRIYTDYQLGRGFIVHAEAEVMNTPVPSLVRNVLETSKRSWVWGMMTGLKTQYKITKRLNGTALFQYNLFDRKHKSPYVDRLNSRIGFEFAMQKRKPKVN